MWVHNAVCRLVARNVGSLAVIVGAQPRLLAPNVGRKQLLFAGLGATVCGPLHLLWRREAARSSGTRSRAHLSLQLVHLGLDHQVHRFMGCDSNIETSLAQIKTTMKMDVLHGKTVPGVLKELTLFAIVEHLVRLVMWPSATLQRIGVERISCLDALRWLSALSTRTPLEAFIVNPIRPHRLEPRVKKRRPKPFPLMITPRQALRQQLVQDKPKG